MPTVSAPLIVKNERNNLPKLLDLLCPVLEEVILVDTGSTDGTIELIKEKQKIYSNIRLEHFKWIKDFSAARNYAFSLATKEYLFFIDGDDLLCQKELIYFKNNVLGDPNVDCWLLDYIYSQRADGSSNLTLGRERFMRRNKNPRWQGAIHESINICDMRSQHYDKLKIIHNRAGKAYEPDRNKEILEAEFKRNPSDPRTAYYYGKELFDQVNPKGIEILEHYVGLNSGFFDDMVNARFRLGKHYASVKKHREAIRQAEEIYHLDFCRQRAEGYWLYGTVEMDLGNYQVATDWFKRCLITPPGSPRVLNLEYYTWNPAKQLAECYHKLQNYLEMMIYRQKTLDFLKDDQETIRWAENLLLKPLIPKLSLQKTGLHDGNNQKLNCDPSKGIPYKTSTINHVSVSTDLDTPTIKELARMMKPCGQLLFSEKPGSYWVLVEHGFNPLSEKVWVKSNPQLPSMGFETGDENFGPYRIQIDNLRKSAIINGYPISISDKPKYFVSNRLNTQSPGEIKILMVCEWLPELDYHTYGIQYANFVAASSDTLAQNMQSKIRSGQKVITVEDHFEMPIHEWQQVSLQMVS